MPESEVQAPPVAKARPRFTTRGGKPRSFTERRTELAEHRIRQTWLGAGFGVQAGPVVVSVTVYLARPLGHYGSGRNAAVLRPSAPAFPAGRPDVDNYAKTALDALNGVAFEDDGRVVTLVARKSYAPPGHPPAWVVSVDRCAGGMPDGDEREGDEGAHDEPQGPVDAVRGGEEHGQRD